MTDEEKFKVWAYDRLIAMMNSDAEGTGTSTDADLRKEYAEAQK